MNPYSESYKLLSPHYIRGMSPFTYYGTWDGKSLKLDISGVNVIAKGYDPYELAANMQRELERAFKESAELKRIGGLLPWLAPMDRGMNRTEDPIRTTATTAAGIAEVVVEWVTGRILELIGGEKSLREAEEYLDQRDAAWMWRQIHKPIRPMAGIAEAFAAWREPPPDSNADGAAGYIELGDALGIERDWVDREVIEGLRQGRRAELEQAGVGSVKAELSGGEASKGAVPCMPEPAIDMPPLPPGTPICPREEKPDERPWFRQQLDGTELGDFLDAVDASKEFTYGIMDGGAKFAWESVCSGFKILYDLNPYFMTIDFWTGKDITRSRQTVDFFTSGYFLEAFPIALYQAMQKVNRAETPYERGAALAELMGLAAGLFGNAYAAGKPGIKSKGPRKVTVDPKVNAARKIWGSDFINWLIRYERLKNNPIPDKYKSLISQERLEHFLLGDGPGSGGHLYPPAAGKTPFPPDWSPEKIVYYATDIASDPSSTWFQQTGAKGATMTKGPKPLPVKFVAEGVREGVKIRVIVEPFSGGRGIVTAFPKQ